MPTSPCGLGPTRAGNQSNRLLPICGIELSSTLSHSGSFRLASEVLCPAQPRVSSPSSDLKRWLQPERKQEVLTSYCDVIDSLMMAEVVLELWFLPDPRRTIPLATFGCMGIVIFVYVIMSSSLTLMIPYDQVSLRVFA